MICPNCQKDVKYKERGGKVCGSCRKRFAVEPKDNPLRLHDMKLIRLSQQLGGNGAYRYTVNQLYFNAARKAVRGKAEFPLGFAVLTVLVDLVLTIIAVATATWALLIPVVVSVAGWALFITYRVATRRTRRIDPPMDRNRFHSLAVEGWRKTYGQDLPGLARDLEVSNLPQHASTPVLVVLAPNRGALAGLRVNDVVNRHRVTLAHSFDQVPPNVPIALLHDVSVTGYVFAAQARAEFGQRVVADLTPRPKAARSAPAALKLRQPWPADDMIGWLRASRLLDEDELDWLAKGWWTPIESVRPSNTLNRLAAVTRRYADPDERAAAAIGFLSWPSS
jgi:hypothetical protein